MLFNSLSFFIFFPVVTTIYFCLPHRFRWFFLLAASVYFYMCFVPVYILILAFTILIDYCAGLLIARARSKKSRKLFLVCSIVVNVGVLLFFKYTNFAVANLNAFAIAIHWNYSINLLKIILPIGLSFHTFQSLSYTIEVYRGKQAVEKNLGIFALYVMFYPQLVAGPIERPQNLLHQFKEAHAFDYAKAASGLKLMTWGFLKKVVIADRLAEYVNLVYGDVHAFQGWQLIVATVFFAFQIHYDFSGYTDIARGAARVMGFELMQNFNNPYHSKSVGEFWRRWHISLSTWFRDYVYIPLGGNRVGAARQVVNIMVVFLSSGLWHGANWTFIIWGGLNGLYLVLGEITVEKRNAIKRFLRIKHVPGYVLIVINFIVICSTWVFFRANTMSDVRYIFGHLFTGFIDWAQVSHIGQQILLGRGVYNFTIVVGCLTLVELASVYAAKQAVPVEEALQGKKWYYRWGAYYAIIFVLLVYSVVGKTTFIYFQF